jgi:uncharacterized membrane protein YhaH (DUF805 family)
MLTDYREDESEAPQPNSYSDSGSEVPMSLPRYGATLRASVIRFWKKYGTFSGRASRNEYWWAVAFLAITGGAINIIASVCLIGDSFAQIGVSQVAPPSPLVSIVFAVVGLWGLVVAIPTYAVTVRRLHDTNRSGFYVLMVLIPFVGVLIVLLLALSTSNPMGKRFDSTKTK